MTFIILSISALTFVGVVLLNVQIAELRKQRHIEVPSDFSDVEEKVNPKQIEFSERIARIKEELSKKQQNDRRGYVADELHPDVQNLDPNEIRTKQLPDVEYAD